MSAAAMPEAPVQEPLTTQPFANLDVAAEQVGIPPKPAEPEEGGFTLKNMKAKMDAANQPKPADPESAIAKSAVEQTPKPTAPDPKAEKPIEITDLTSDDDLNKHVESQTKGKSKADREWFQHNAFKTREAKRQGAQAAKELDTAKSELTKLKANAADGEVSQTLQKKLDAAQKRIEDQEVKLAAVNLMETEMFKNDIALPKSKIIEDFKQLAADYTVDPEELIGLAGLRGRALDDKVEELAVNLGTRGAQRLNSLLDRIADVNAKESAMTKNAKASYDAYLANTKASRDEQLAKLISERNEALPKVWEEKIVKSAPFLKEVDGDADWNKKLAEAKTFLNVADRNWLEKQDTTTTTEFAARAAVHPLLLARVTHLEAELARLRQHNGELRGVTPGVDGGAAERQPAVEETKPGTWNPVAKARSMI